MSQNTNQQQNNLKYDPVILPLDYNKSFLDLTGKEIHAYYNWFLSVKGERLDHVCTFLFQRPKDCLKEENLKVIEIFLLNSVSTLSKPISQLKEEASKIPMYLKPYAEPDKYVFDKRTISICYDLAIFLGELIIGLDNKIKWELESDEMYADFGQPILAKKNIKLRLNPFRVLKNIAAKIYEGVYSDGELLNVFNAWKKGYKVY